MPNLQKYNAKICNTAAGILVCEGKVLFIKHKKLGIWFAPGGHIDDNELPHVAAEREFWEETGVKVKAIDPHFLYQKATDASQDTEFLPSPIESNLHWVSQENYDKRLASDDVEKRVESKIWSRGCEQHLGLLYMVEAVDAVDNDGNVLDKISDIKFEQNVEETDGIAWFTIEELENIETHDDIKKEVKHVLEILKFDKTKKEISHE